MTDKFTNFGTSTIADVGGIGVDATEFSVQGGHGALFPTVTTGESFYIVGIKATGEREIMKCTARTDDTLTVSRAQEGTTALVFEENDKVEHRVTAATLTEFMQKADYIQPVFVNNANGNPNLSDTRFSVYPAGLPLGTRQSIGYSGSGATHSWTALDSVPLFADWIEVSCHVSLSSTSNDGTQNYVSVGLGGADAEVPQADYIVPYFNWFNLTAVTAVPKTKVAVKKIPITAGIFYGIWDGSVSSGPWTISLTLTGYGFNS